jgi:hypothetical protein
MSTLAKLLLVPAVLVAGVVGVALAADGPPSFSADPIAPAGDTTATTAATTTTETGARVDSSGPCDEAEHANDPRCAGVTVPRAAARVGGVDISGPCDEAEYANDPRCTGAAGARSDNSGRGSDDQGGRRGRGGDFE